MPKFCVHEQHGGMCEKVGGYCIEGACPYEDMRDFAEVVHGRWICIRKRYGEYECSACHGLDSNCSDYYGTHATTEQEFCPNCGAKMDEEETNELDKREG